MFLNVYVLKYTQSCITIIIYACSSISFAGCCPWVQSSRLLLRFSWLSKLLFPPIPGFECESLTAPLGPMLCFVCWIRNTKLRSLLIWHYLTSKFPEQPSRLVLLHTKNDSSSFWWAGGSCQEFHLLPCCRKWRCNRGFPLQHPGFTVSSSFRFQIAGKKQ